MEIIKIIQPLENLAPLKTQEEWDNSGFQIYINRDIKKILLCLSVTQNIINQAIEKNCDMIISHHPLFMIPFEFNKNIPIYSAHTNLDKANGGTTDTLIETLGLSLKKESLKIEDFLRIIELEEEQGLATFINLIKEKLNLKAIRVVNNLKRKKVKKIAFCAGSGADFTKKAHSQGADAIVTGDVKYHTALDSNVIIIDIGHFESEIPVLKTIKKILEKVNIEVLIADEKSPFINY